MPARRHLIQVLALLCLGSSIAFAQLSYTTTFSTNVDGNPGGLAAADFNRDGKPDLAVLRGTTASVFLNLGAGKFSAPIDSPFGSGFGAGQALAADINNDGKIDLVAMQSNQSLVMLGNGDGTFQAGLPLLLANEPSAIRLGDFNGDGKIDLAVRACPFNSLDCDITVYLGQGNGMFTLDVALPAPGAGSIWRDLVVTDLNRDGTLDIAVAALDVSTSPSTSNFMVFFGRGDGTFKAPVVTQVPFTASDGSPDSLPTIVAGDFNGEATPDIGVETGSDCGTACGEGVMNIFIDNGAGGFTLKQSFLASENEGPDFWMSGDLNNDLRPDLMRLSSSDFSGAFKTWENNGTGIFTSVTNPYSNIHPGFAEIRDLDLSGRHALILSQGNFGTTDLFVGSNHNGTPNCPPPPSNVLQAKLCTPGTTTTSTTFTVKASGNSPVGIKRLELWVDGTKRGQALSDQLLTSLTLTKGIHQVTVVAVDQYIGIAKNTTTVNVQ
jgi:hypothetical protein